MFFVIADLALIDPMYQFSLTYFKRLFSIVIDNAEKSDEILKRVKILIDQITIIIYLNVCRGLFNDHKKIFSFLVASAISLKSEDISKQEWNAFNRGVVSFSKEKLVLPQGSKFSEKVFKSLVDLSLVNPIF